MKDNPEHILTLIGAERTVFGLADLEAAFDKRLQAAAADIQPLMDKVLAHPALVALDDFGRGGHRLYTTRANVVQEMNLIEQVRSMKDTPFTDPSGFAPIAMPEHLGHEQRDAVEAMLNSDPITLVTGYAGAGKTTAIAQAAKIWKERGFDVFGGALSGRVTQELSGVEGMELASLAAWEARWARGRRPQAGKFVVFMDEAAMVGPDVWARVQTRVLKMGGKLIAVGDPEQLQPISAGNAFKAIEVEVGSTVIQEVRRQQDPEERRFTKMLAHGGAEAVEAIRGYADRGAIVFMDDEAACVAALSKDYCDRGRQDENRTIIAYTNRDVNLLNEGVREERLRRGIIDPAMVENYGLIERVDRSSGVARRETAALLLGKGDRVIFKQAHADLRIPKSAFADVIATRPGEVDLVIDGDVPRQVTIDMNTFNHFDYGFASTIHNAQSVSKGYSGGMAHGYMDKHGLYVTLSRHIISTKLYVPRTRIENMATLERLVQRTSYQSLAVSEVQGRVQESFVPGLSSVDVGGRADWTPDRQTDFSISFEGDAHLASIANRMTGLLASNYRDGDPAFGDDPKGYTDNPKVIIDDLILRQSTLRATDVARVLSGVVKEPDHYARLFREAMSHPDLVVLSEEGEQGEGRIYSTKAQVALELDVIDRGISLSYDRVEVHQHYIKPLDETRALAVAERFGLSDEQIEASMAGLENNGLAIISGGSGSGKTRVAGALGEIHAQEGWQVLPVSPTGVGADNLRAAGDYKALKRDAMTLAGLEYAVKEGRVLLDPKTVIILDEAGLIGAKSTDRLFDLLESSGAKLLAFRDTDQLNPYEAGPVFQALDEHLGSASLEGQYRGQNKALSAALRNAAEPLDADIATQGLMDANVLHAGGTRAASLEQVALNYVNDPSESKIALAHSRADVAVINAAVRKGLDARMEDRDAHHSSETLAGTLADLQAGDKIALRSYHAGSRSRAGTQFIVERRDETGVVLRTGSGDEAQFIKFEGEDPSFEYGFNFATTIHGSKGGSFESVHMLASTGMSGRMFSTAAQLHQRALNVVVATSADNLEATMKAILQTRDTARSVLDYGFDAAYLSQEAVKGKTYFDPRDTVDTNYVKARQWIVGRVGTDPLPKGVGREAIAELVGAQILETGRPPSGVEAHRIANFVANISDNGDWELYKRELPKGIAEQADRLALSVAGPGSDGKPLATARVLARGAVILDASGAQQLKGRFESGLSLYGKRVALARDQSRLQELEPNRANQRSYPDPAVREQMEADYKRRFDATNQKQKHRFNFDNPLNLTLMSEAQAARWLLRKITGPKHESLIEKVVELYQEYRTNNKEQEMKIIKDQPRMDVIKVADREVVRERIPNQAEVQMQPAATVPVVPMDVKPDKHRDMARGFASTVSRHIMADDPIHERDDLAGDIEKLLKASDKVEGAEVNDLAKSFAERRAVNDLKKEIIQELDKNFADLVIKHGLYDENVKNPFQASSAVRAAEFDTIFPKRLELLKANSALETISDTLAAKAKVFTNSGLSADKVLSDNLVKATHFEATTAKDGHSYNADRQNILKDLEKYESFENDSFPKQSGKLLTRLYKSFTRNEIKTLVNSKAKVPTSLSLFSLNKTAVNKGLCSLSRSFPNDGIVPLHSPKDLQDVSMDIERNLDGPSME